MMIGFPAPLVSSSAGTIMVGGEEVEPLIFLGFKADPAVYTADGEAVAVGDLVTENASFGNYSPSDIQEGVGLVGSDPVFFGDALDLLTDGATILCTFVLAPSDGIYFEMVDSDEYNLDYLANFRQTAAGPCGVSDGSDTTNHEPLPTGTHKAALTMIDGKLAVSINGGAVFKVDPAVAWTPAPQIVVFGGAGTIEEIGLYPAQNDADLPSLSANGSPVISVAPVVSGTAQVGETLTCTTGTWTNSPSGYAYQWRKGPFSIDGETTATYEPVEDDIGSPLHCMVTATNASGAANAFSNSTDPVVEA